ncbi:Protein GDS1 [Nakaseomyces bracarensis]|uniref:Protein GDS1 n=1 Tax=Nakaseomyces bracarensis TaxID=273131 RepID=A0ABR4NMN6_9SACH
MALANSRPMQIPHLEADLLHNTTSPVFQPTSLGFSPMMGNADLSMNMTMGMENALLSPISADLDNTMANNNTISTTIPNIPNNNNSNNNNNNNNSGKKQRKESTSVKKESVKEGSSSNAGPNNIMIELSKMIPVTGERPKPTERTEPLDDDVLHAVFLILWELDADQQGMTVKQICDHLLVRHPDMSNLSTKLSNLISAKLNAYVKKIEKGEKTMTYALSREWSNSSPRRMLYIYRGILSADYKKHAQAASEQLRKQQELSEQTAGKKKAGSIDLSADSPLTDMSSGSENTSINGALPPGIATSANPAAMQFSKGVSSGFTFSPDFNIPYSTSPVSVNLSPAVEESESLSPTSTPSKLNDKKRPSSNTDSMKIPLTPSSKSGSQTPTDKPISKGPANKKQKLKTLEDKNINENTWNEGTKSESSTNMQAAATIRNSGLNSTTTSTNYITAAAAAPRLSRSSSKSSFKSSSQASASALAAIQKVITTQLPIEVTSTRRPSLSRSASIVSNRSPSSFTESLPNDSNITTPSSVDESKSLFSTSSFSYENPANAMWFKIVREGFLTSDIDPPESLSLEDLENIMS